MCCYSVEINSIYSTKCAVLWGSKCTVIIIFLSFTLLLPVDGSNKSEMSHCVQSCFGRPVNILFSHLRCKSGVKLGLLFCRGAGALM